MTTGIVGGFTAGVLISPVIVGLFPNSQRLFKKKAVFFGGEYSIDLGFSYQTTRLRSLGNVTGLDHDG